jgi:hypothetical protein
MAITEFKKQKEAVILTFLNVSPLMPAYHMRAADALGNRRYTRLDHICSELFGIQNTGTKSALSIDCDVSWLCMSDNVTRPWKRFCIS